MHIESFDNLEDMFARQAELDAAAFAAILPKQKGMKPGDFWVRPVVEIGSFIWGQWHDMDTLVQDEMEAGATEEEADAVRQHEEAKAQRGYMFGTAYSPDFPDGDLGTTHQAVVWPISEGEFLSAKENGWEIGVPRPGDPENPYVARWFVNLCERVAREVVDDVVEAQSVEPLINLHFILLILRNPQWHEPKQPSKFDEDMVLERVETDGPYDHFQDGRP